MQLWRYKSLTLTLAAALVICYFMGSAGQHWFHDPAEAPHSEFLHRVIELLPKEAVFACTQRKNEVITSHNLHHLSVTFNSLNADLNPICHLLALLGSHHILHVSRIRVNLTPADELVMHAELLQLIHDTISFSVKTEQLYFTNQLFSRSE